MKRPVAEARVVDLLGLLKPAEHHAGGRLFPLRPGIIGSAVFAGPLNCYRLSLYRRWSTSLRSVLVIGMNPSTARGDLDDTSIAKITRMARSWRDGSFGSMTMANVFAYRCTDQMRLAEVDDPVGPENDATIDKLARQADLVVFAFGKPKLPMLRRRGFDVAERLAAIGIAPHVLRLSNDGTPWHPLLLPDATEPTPWKIQA